MFYYLFKLFFSFAFFWILVINLDEGLWSLIKAQFKNLLFLAQESVVKLNFSS